jgi:hypothetical protein
MTTRQGPGGAIPRDNRPVAAKGVGKNSKRHDLERPSTPGLHGSDLQQGDVQALEQGQRIAPVQQQASALPEPPPQRGAREQLGEDGVMPSVDEIITTHLGGTLDSEPIGSELDHQANHRAETWLHVLSTLARQPGASPLLRSRVQTLQQAVRQNPARMPQGGALFLRDVDEQLEG